MKKRLCILLIFTLFISGCTILSDEPRNNSDTKWLNTTKRSFPKSIKVLQNEKEADYLIITLYLSGFDKNLKKDKLNFYDSLEQSVKYTENNLTNDLKKIKKICRVLYNEQLRNGYSINLVITENVDGKK